MKRNKLTNEEMGALLGAFSDLRQELSGSITQHTLFKIALLFSNFFIIFFFGLFILIQEGGVSAISQDLLVDEFFAVFSGKATAMFWILAIINISFYFNIGFKIVSLCGMIYAVNSVVDLFILFHEQISFLEAPYISSFILVSPMLACSIAVMVFTHKASIEL